MNLKKLKERGASFVQYTIILAFVMIIGLFFINDKNLGNTISDIFGEGADILAVATGNEPTHNGGSGDAEGGTGDGSSEGGGSKEPPKPLPEDNPDFAQITVHGIFPGGYNSLGGLGSGIIYPLYEEFKSQVPMRDEYNQYQAREFDYISWENNKVTIGFKTINGFSHDPVNITVTEDSQFTRNLVQNGISTDKGIIVIDDGGQLVQHNSDKTVYTSLDILPHDGTEYVHYGY